MTHGRWMMSCSILGALALLLIGACAGPQPPEAEAPEAAASAGAKVPLTTSSEEARAAFVQGRDLTDKLRAQEARAFFEQAVDADPEFAMAHLFLANTQATPQGFFAELKEAVERADQASAGERLWILGSEAGVNGDPARQRELYTKLVEAYPGDERAHTLLGNYFFGQQEWERAIEEYTVAIEIDPDYSQSYNQLGYAQRFLERFDEAEKAFEKYIELIPDDPNPYDSYAELLLKVGRFDESIDSYEKALEVNPTFLASYLGIATNLNLKGEHEAARDRLRAFYDDALDDGQRRACLFATGLAYVYEGNLNGALGELEKQYALAEATGDAPAMAGDLNVMGTILLEVGRPDEAMSRFERSIETMEGSGLSEEVIANARRGFLFNSARVALAKGDLESARAKAEEFRAEAEGRQNRFQIWQAHQLAGMIALEEGRFEEAAAELAQSNLQNPYNIYRQALAAKGQGDQERGTQLCQRAATFNPVNNLNHAFIWRTAQGC